MNNWFKKQMLFFICIMGVVISNGQVVPIKLKSLTYSPNIIMGDDYHPFFQKVEADLRLYDKVDIKFSQGLFGVSYGSYQENVMVNTFSSQTGITQSIDLNITPIRISNFRVNVGGGLAYLYIKQFRTLRQKSIDVGYSGASLILPFQYFDVDKQSKIGLDFYIDLEYILSNHFALSVSANALNFKSTLTRDYGYFSTGLNAVYYIDSQL